MNNLTVSLELAQALKEAGFTQGSAFNYYKSGLKSGEWFLQYGGHQSVKKWVAAPTAEEVLSRLPRWINAKLGKHEMTVRKSGVNEFPYWVGYHEFAMTGESLAEAAGKMFIYLKKEGLL